MNQQDTNLIASIILSYFIIGSIYLYRKHKYNKAKKYNNMQKAKVIGEKANDNSKTNSNRI